MDHLLRGDTLRAYLGVRPTEGSPIFGDEVMAAALIDRLLHHCHIVSLG